MLTEEHIAYLAKMDGISLEAERKKVEEMKRDTHIILKQQGLPDLTDEQIEQQLINVIEGHKSRSKPCEMCRGKGEVEAVSYGGHSVTGKCDYCGGIGSIYYG